MSLLRKIRAAEFLASEFLTWLLYRAEIQQAVWTSSQGGSFELWPDDRLRIEAPVEGVTGSLLSGGTPSRSPEARSALAAGKLVQEARWKLVRDEREWLFTLRSPELALRSVRLPELLSREEDERIRERLALLASLEQTLEELFRRFLELRLSPRWKREEVPAVGRWMAAGVRSEA